MADTTLHLLRTQALEHATLGQLFLDGAFKWYTLEDRLREGQPKVPGETCIPAGRYEIVITKSQRFGRMLPLLLNVPGFTGIRIHPGNTDADTAGCVLVGGSCQPDAKPVPFLGHSAVACQAVQSYIAGALARGNRVWIEIVDPAKELPADADTEGEATPAGQIAPVALPGGTGPEIIH